MDAPQMTDYCSLIEFARRFDNNVPISMQGYSETYLRRFYNVKILIDADRPDVNIEMLNNLLNEGADVNFIDHGKNSVLHHIVRNAAASIKIVQFLLEAGAYPDARNRDDKPPLAFCIEIPIAKLLIQYTVMHKMFTNIFKKNGQKANESVSAEAENILNLSFCEDILYRNYLAAYRDSCIAEMKLMMKDKIAENFTFFNFITQHCLKNHEAFEIVQDFDESCITKILLRLYDINYPYYHDLIYSAIRLSNIKVTGRMFDLQIYMVDPLISDPTKTIILLNVECSNKIEEFLNKKDIVNLILTFVPKSKLTKMLTSKREMEEGEENSPKRLKSIMEADHQSKNSQQNIFMHKELSCSE